MEGRRQVYTACATVLLARRGAVTELRELFLADQLDQTAVTNLLAEIETLRPDAERAVGALLVEGPPGAAHAAQVAAKTIRFAAARYRDWTADIVGGRDLNELRISQMQYANEDQGDMERWVDDFAEECQKVLYPNDRIRLPLRYRTGSRARRRWSW